MKTLLKLYTASCIVVLAFFTFFSLPLGLMPFSDGVNLLVVGGVIAAFVAFYVGYFYRREGFEFGWFLAKRGGFWIIVLALFAAVLLLFGTLMLVSPDAFMPAIEQGALPFGVAIVSMFWLALIFMFGFITFGLLSQLIALMKLRRLSGVIFNLLLGLFCLFLTAVFFSLFVEVINDIAIRIASDYQWRATLVFAAVLAAAAVVYGIRQQPDNLIDDEPSPGDN